MVGRRYWFFAVVLASGVLAASCAVPAVQPSVPAYVAMATSTPAVAASEPATPSPTPAAPTPEPATPTPEPATPTASVASQRLNLDEFLPPGKGRDLLIMNCGSCHSFVCAVRGQRGVGHWEQLRRQHRGNVPGLPDEDYSVLFAYLSENLNDTQPEPKLPPQLAEQGCSSGIQ